jgi:short-subunit dehydrogenase
MTPEDVVKVALRALGAGRSQVVAGWGNKAYTFAGSKLPKPVSARIAGKILAKRRPRSSEK